MKRYLLAAAASSLIATPAAARNDHWYLGAEFGVLLPQDDDSDVLASTVGNSIDLTNALATDYKTSFEGDLIAGYDFGLLRIEAEAGWKHPSINQFEFSDAWLSAVGDAIGSAITSNDVALEDNYDIITGMMNILVDVDFDPSGRAGFYAGGGLGSSWVKAFGDSEGSFAWQGIAGVRYAVTPSVDVGLKYRYFQTDDLDFRASGIDVGGSAFNMDLHGRFHSHSLLASTVYNFGVSLPPPPPLPPLPPPPPPPPPATQTCPDGSVILATENCPMPPPPPPPPPPTPERG